MKEAAGEANITVITIVLIGVVAAAGAVLIPRLMGTVEKRAECNELGGKLSGNRCNFDPKHYKHGAYCTMAKCATGTTHAGEWKCGADCND